MADADPDTPHSAIPVGYAPIRPSAKTTSLATIALVLGITGIIPVCGFVALAGIICGVVSLATRRPGWRRAVAGIALGLVLPPLALYAASILQDVPRNMAKQASCGASLREISGAVQAYSRDHGGVMPTSLDVLVAEKRISWGHLRSASADGSRKVDFFYQPYAGTATPDCIIACDFGSTHGRKKRHVLYMDGRVSWISEKQFQAELAKPCNAAFAPALRAAE